MKDYSEKNEDRAGDSGDHPREIPALAAIAYRWRRFLLLNVIAAAVISAGVSFLLPVWYKSTASIIPPRDQDILNPFGAASSVLKGLNLGGKIGGSNLGTYNYLAILKSRSAMDSVVRKFGLMDAYGIDDTSMEKAVRELKENVAFEIQDDDYFTIEVFDRDPGRAADMANYFVEVLNSMSLQLGTREARNNREFIERRLEASRQDLRRAEEKMRAYQEESKMMIVPDQASSSVGGIAELYGMKAKKEIELAILKKSVASDDPAIRQLELELNELDRKLESFPEIGIASIRFYRDVLIQQKIVEFLIPLFEQARVDEQKDVPVLLVLDRAVRAEKKSKPQRSLIVLTAVFLTFFVSLLAAFVFHRSTSPGGGTGPLDNLVRKYAEKTARIYKITSRV